MIGKKKLWYLGGIVVIALALWMVSRPGGPLVPSPSESPSTSATAKPGAAMPKTYSDAVKAYANKRIQFDQYCQAIPKSLVFKNGVSLMLDNRSGDARKVKINGVTYSLSGYGWKIITLQLAASKLPAHLDIDCGSAQNVSYIILEK